VRLFRSEWLVWLDQFLFFLFLFLRVKWTIFGQELGM